MGSALLFLLLLGILLLTPNAAYAWGPATHLQLGVEVLKNAYFLKEALRGLLLQNAYSYLYGCIAADIIFAKGLAKLHEHSHSWGVGLGILTEASTPSQQAFAYGYLSHLASDIVAHNHFVPECMIKTYSTRTLRHLYWEVRFDTAVKTEYWALAKEVASSPCSENDDLLERIVTRTLFSFRTDKTIFNGLLVLNRMGHWQRMLNNVSKKSAWELSPLEVERYRKLSLGSSLDFLVHRTQALCFRKDPIGKDALLSAKWMRRNLKILDRKGRLTPALYAGVINSLREDCVPPPTQVPYSRRHDPWTSLEG